MLRWPSRGFLHSSSSRPWAISITEVTPPLRRWKAVSSDSATCLRGGWACRARLGWREPGLFETLQRAERGTRDPALTDEEALQLVQALEQYSGLLQLKPRQSEEKRAWPSR